MLQAVRARRMSLLLALALGLVVALTVLSSAGADVAPDVGSTGNLLGNPDAESGPGGNGAVKPIPRWTKGSTNCGADKPTVIKYGAQGGFPKPGSPGPPDRGAKFFAGGPTICSPYITQFVDLTHHADPIDAGLAKFTLSGWFGGFKTQNDTAGIEVDFYRDNGKFISKSSTGYPNSGDRGGVTGFLFSSVSDWVPHAARGAWVTIFFIHHTAGYNDGYADNVDFDMEIHSST
jgi:hypothetical protein